MEIYKVIGEQQPKHTALLKETIDSQFEKNVSVKTNLAFNQIRFQGLNQIKIVTSVMTIYYPKQSIYMYKMLSEFDIVISSNDRINGNTILSQYALDVFLDVTDNMLKLALDELNKKLLSIGIADIDTKIIGNKDDRIKFLKDGLDYFFSQSL